MTQQYSAQIKTKLSLVVFIKGSSTPLILYVENPIAVYNEFLQAIKTSSAGAKLIEKETLGPIKKIAILSTQIASVALQEEQYQ